MGNKLSTIIAIIPPEDVLQSLDGVIAGEVHSRVPHITLAYIEKTDEIEFSKLRTVVKDTVENELHPIRIQSQGAGFFDNEGRCVQFILFNGKHLDQWIYRLKNNIRDETGIQVTSDALIPHLTVNYAKEIEPGWEQPLLDIEELTWICNTVYILRGKMYIPYEAPIFDPLTK